MSILDFVAQQDSAGKLMEIPLLFNEIQKPFARSFVVDKPATLPYTRSRKSHSVLTFINLPFGDPCGKSNGKVQVRSQTLCIYLFG
jgi:hypothetical protein